jgi:hypothetical protein
MSIIGGIVGLSTGSVIYPATPKEQDKIPLWLKMTAFEFSQSSVVRSARDIFGGPILRNIMVPAPKQFSTKTLLRYDDSIDDAGTNLTKADPTAFIDSILGGEGSWWEFAKKVASGADEISETMGFGASKRMDMYDCTFQSASKRAFSTKIIMPAWTSQDADAACYVSDTLEAFSLPQVKPETTLTKTVRVPAMWQVGIGSSNSVKFDQLWSGQPQLCVLASVVTNKMGFNDAYGISDSGSTIKPMCVVVDLTFLEIEPAFRDALGTNAILNRSKAFTTAGGTIRL